MLNTKPQRSRIRTIYNIALFSIFIVLVIADSIPRLQSVFSSKRRLELPEYEWAMNTTINTTTTSEVNMPPPSKAMSKLQNLLEEARLVQAEFCKYNFSDYEDKAGQSIWMMKSQVTIPGIVSTPPQMFEMMTYSQNDIVSKTINSTGNWEIDHYNTFITILEKYAQSKGLRKSEVTFVDIGSNIGWFSISIANAGFRVIAFDPMPKNEILFRSSICLNNLTSSISFFPYGLSNKKATCRLVSMNDNEGNGIVSCDDIPATPSNRALRRGKSYVPRADIQAVRLDDFFPSEDVATELHIPVFKMDVEGMEAFVMEGGRKFFSSPTIVYGVTEFNVETRDFRLKLANEIQFAGFDSVATVGFPRTRGSFEFDITDNKTVRSLPLNNIYLRKTAGADLLSL